jgi:hypothetical protein
MNLSRKQREFSRQICKLLRALDSMGYEVTFGEAWRAPETAAQYARDGRGISNSLHTMRLAFDLNLWRNNKYLTRTEEYRQAGELWESYSTDEFTCHWGGRFGDGNHFSIGHFSSK